MKEIRALAPTGAVGYTPLDEETFYAGLSENPDFIGADAGSPDSGPMYVATSTHYGSYAATKHDLRLMLLGAIERKIPLIVGGASGFGSRQDVMWKLNIISEIAKEENLSFDMAIVYTDVDKNYLKKRVREEKIEGLGLEEPLTIDAIERSDVIAAQVGPEPLIKAIKSGVQVILAGRVMDDAIFASIPIYKGYDKGLALHMGKIIECGAACAEPDKNSIAHGIMGVIREDHFLIKGTSKSQRVSVDSVAQHTLYEVDHPYIHAGPGGINNLKESVYEQLNPTTVKVSGSLWLPGDYKVRIEGAGRIGYRTISIDGIRCPILLSQLDSFLEQAKSSAYKVYGDIYGNNSFKIIFHVYGKNAVMGSLEPNPEISNKEVALVTEVIADEQEIANEVCGYLKHSMLFQSYPGQISTAGNLAHLNSVEVLPAEGSFEFTIDHLLPIDNPEDFCQIEFRKYRKGAVTK